MAKRKRRGVSSLVYALAILFILQITVMAGGSVDSLVQTAQNKQEKFTVRHSAILKLGQTPGEEAYKALINLLYDKEIREKEEIFGQVLWAVSQRGDERAIEHLKKLFDEEVQQEAVEAILMVLWGFRDHSLDKRVLAMLKSGEIDLSTVVYSRYLRITDPIVRDTFVNLLLKQLGDKSYSRRSDAVRIIRGRLFTICDERVVEPLIQLLEDQEVAKRKGEMFIAEALFKICLNELGSSNPEDFKAVKPEVIVQLAIETDPATWKKWWAENKATFDLRKQTIASLRHYDPLIRQMALKKMVWIKDSQGDAILRSLVKDDSENSLIRVYAARALAARGDRKSLLTLIEVLEDCSDEKLFCDLLRVVSYVDNNPPILKELRFQIASRKLSPEQRGRIMSALREWVANP